LGIGDWGLGIGDWGLGIGDWAQSPIPNPHPQGNINFYLTIFIKIFTLFMKLNFKL
jgi:hypothetical protein